MTYLPGDIIGIIVSNLPAVCILDCMLVCKEWRESILSNHGCMSKIMYKVPNGRVPSCYKHIVNVAFDKLSHSTLRWLALAPSLEKIYVYGINRKSICINRLSAKFLRQIRVRSGIHCNVDLRCIGKHVKTLKCHTVLNTALFSKLNINHLNVTYMRETYATKSQLIDVSILIGSSVRELTLNTFRVGGLEKTNITKLIIPAIPPVITQFSTITILEVDSHHVNIADMCPLIHTLIINNTHRAFNMIFLQGCDELKNVKVHDLTRDVIIRLDCKNTINLITFVQTGVKIDDVICPLSTSNINRWTIVGDIYTDSTLYNIDEPSIETLRFIDVSSPINIKFYRCNMKQIEFINCPGPLMSLEIINCRQLESISMTNMCGTIPEIELYQATALKKISLGGLKAKVILDYIGNDIMICDS